MERIGSLPSVTSSAHDARSLRRSQTTTSPRCSQSVATDAAIAIVGQFPQERRRRPGRVRRGLCPHPAGLPGGRGEGRCGPADRHRAGTVLAVPAGAERAPGVPRRAHGTDPGRGEARARARETRRYLDRPADVATPEERERASKRWFDEIRPATRDRRSTESRSSRSPLKCSTLHARAMGRDPEPAAPVSARDIIPRFEPEVVEAEARRRWHGDDEKVATTAVKVLVVRGVEITSRYQKADELELMGRIIDAMPPCVSARIESVWCDSKACHCYSITLKARRALRGSRKRLRSPALCSRSSPSNSRRAQRHRGARSRDRGSAAGRGRPRLARRLPGRPAVSAYYNEITGA
jgi:hypothetical protein